MRSRVKKRKKERKRAQGTDGMETAASLAGGEYREAAGTGPGERARTRPYEAPRPPVRVHLGLSQNHLPLPVALAF